MPQGPEQIEAMLRRIREMRKFYGDRAEALREHGLEVDAFLGDCDEFIAAMEGRHEGEFDLKDFLRRVGEFKDEAEEFVHIQQQVQAAEGAYEWQDMLPQLEKMAAEYRERGEPMDLLTAEEMEAALGRIRAGLAGGKPDKDALHDLELAALAEMAELQRRIHFREAACLLYWEQWPPERWARTPAEDRKTIAGALEQWREKREEILGALPLEDRRRLEALRYEDFDQPGACDP
jgi:hypothetical protein